MAKRNWLGRSVDNLLTTFLNSEGGAPYTIACKQREIALRCCFAQAAVMPPRSVLVTYTLHPSPNPGSVHPIQVALKGIRAQIPLRNLHWKSSSRTALRTIQELDVTLLELGEVGSVSKEVGGSVLQWPLVDLCLVVCEVSPAF